jgi:hypothetical protein
MTDSSSGRVPAWQVQGPKKKERKYLNLNFYIS